MTLPMSQFGREGKTNLYTGILTSCGEHLFVRYIIFCFVIKTFLKDLRMWIEVFGLSCLLSILEAHQIAPTLNPECDGMKTATTNLQQGILTLLKKPSSCEPNPHCTGVKCTWSSGGYLEIDLHHCSNPVNYHVLLNAPEKHIFRNLTLKEGDERKLFNNFKIHVTDLSREGNQVTTTVKLEVCYGSLCNPLYTLVDQKFCVRMQNCPDFNASTTHHYKPCKYNPTGSPVDISTIGHSTIDRSTRHAFMHTSSGSPVDISTIGHSTIDRSTRHAFMHTSSVKSDYRPTGSIGAQKGERHKAKDDSKKLSTAAIIGICAASVFAILIVLAAGVYWKKYHHRSRLRAAYYNDISMHDPLYEDFGPEVA